jgi:hypothetical protein
MCLMLHLVNSKQFVVVNPQWNPWFLTNLPTCCATLGLPKSPSLLLDDDKHMQRQPWAVCNWVLDTSYLGPSRYVRKKSCRKPWSVRLADQSHWLSLMFPCRKVPLFFDSPRFKPTNQQYLSWGPLQWLVSPQVPGRLASGFNGNTNRWQMILHHK